MRRTRGVPAVFSMYLAVVGICAFLSIPARAAEVTPSQVYQATEEFYLLLKELKLVDEERYKKISWSSALRHPRHVMQQVNQCHLMISKLLVEKGINPSRHPDVSFKHEIRPKDVNNAVRHLIQETRKLGGCARHVATPVSGKLPIDVYNHLKRICYSITKPIVPSDLYQIASLLAFNMERIADSRQYEVSMPKEVPYGQVSAEQFQKKVQDFIKELRDLTLHSDFAIPGGVVLASYPEQTSWMMRDTLVLLNDAIADTNAIKYALHIRSRVLPSSLDESKTLSDAYGKILYAHSILKLLLKLEAGQPGKGRG